MIIEIQIYMLIQFQNIQRSETKKYSKYRRNKRRKKITEKKKKKVSTIEIEENIEEESWSDNSKEACNRETFIEVKDKIFTKFSHDIKEQILYEKRVSNKRKNEHILEDNFCNALIKRKNDKKHCYYIFEKDHSKEYIEYSKITYINYINVIGNYNEFINKCLNYLDSTEVYNKNVLIIKLQEIYNNNKYNFKLKENTLMNLIGKWKAIP